MTPLFYPISARAAGHQVRRTLLELRWSAAMPCYSKRSNYYLAHQLDIEAVRWLDLHCHLNALVHYRSRRHESATH